MRLRVQHEWHVGKKDTLGVLLRRVLDAATNAGLGAPAIGLLAGECLIGTTSAIARVLKRFPELADLRTKAPQPGKPDADVLTVKCGAPSALTQDLLLAVADGVPRSWALGQVGVTLHWQEFGQMEGVPTGVQFVDNWWVNGRMRSLSAVMLVEADPGAPDIVLPERVAAMLRALGKPARVGQQQVAEAGAAARAKPPGLDELFARHRAAMVARIDTLPHVLAIDARNAPAGPKKPALEAAFAPMGYAVRGETGAFTLSRRTPGNLVVEVDVDVGTWSNRYMGVMKVYAPAWTVSMKLLLAHGSEQVPIGGPEGWQRIVDNLAAQVTPLDREFVPEVEALLGPAPAWFERRP